MDEHDTNTITRLKPTETRLFNKLYIMIFFIFTLDLQNIIKNLLIPTHMEIIGCNKDEYNTIYLDTTYKYVVIE